MTKTTPRVRPPRRPDESMSLLNDLFAEPLDPGYHEASLRHRERAAPKLRGWRFSPALIFGMVALGLLLTMAALQVRDTANVVSSEREGLIERIHSEDENVSQLQQTVESLESEIDGLEESLLQNSAQGQQLRDEVQQLQVLSGGTPVTGPGVVVTLENAPEAEAAERPELARVLAIDVQQVVNGLWAAGAEAVSINGQRITALTAIRQVNNVIKINYRPTNAPFEIVAIGDSRSMPSEFSDGPGGQWLRHVVSSNGLLFDVQSDDSLTVPAGSTSLNHAQPGEAS